MSDGWTALRTLDGVVYWQDGQGRLSLDSPEVMAQDSLSKSGGTLWVWVSDEQEGWLPGRMQDANTVLVDNKPVRLDGSRTTLPLLRSTLDRPIVDDLVILEDLNEGLVHPLQKASILLGRHRASEVLCSVVPR